MLNATRTIWNFQKRAWNVKEFFAAWGNPVADFSLLLI